MYTLAVTDLDWHDFLLAEQPLDLVNFWTPTDWRIQGVQSGSRWYFLLKSPVRKIGGYGVYRSYDTMLLSEAWRRYGTHSGAASADALRSKILPIAEKRAKDYVPTDDPLIGCAVLERPVFFEPSDFIDPGSHGVDFPRQIVTRKSYQGVDPLEGLVDYINHAGTFSLVSGIPTYRRGSRKSRAGQAQFRQKVLDAYGGRCCVTGTSVLEVIQAAHIQPYISSASNHVQNGLPLRMDIHALFDDGLIALSERLTVRVSSRLAGSTYEELDGRAIIEPEAGALPSLEAVREHLKNTFVD